MAHDCRVDQARTAFKNRDSMTWFSLHCCESSSPPSTLTSLSFSSSSVCSVCQDWVVRETASATLGGRNGNHADASEDEEEAERGGGDDEDTEDEDDEDEDAEDDDDDDDDGEGDAGEDDDEDEDDGAAGENAQRQLAISRHCIRAQTLTENSALNGTSSDIT
jgi:hypothetical protein